MNLQLKHFGAYLPYEVEIYEPNAEGRNTFTLDVEGLRVMEAKGFEYYKLILRPLSDLTKEVEVNGETFVPMLWFEKNINRNISFYKPSSRDIEIDIITEDYSEVFDLFDGYKATQKLLEWHFDIFGLIDQGLAIDYNTLNK